MTTWSIGFVDSTGSSVRNCSSRSKESKTNTSSLRRSRPRADLDRWLDSDTRRSWLAETQQLIEGDRTMNVVGGFGGWFPAQPSRPQGPKRWKQSVAVFIALFPTTLTITLVRSEVAPNMNVVLAVLIGNVLGILALS